MMRQTASFRMDEDVRTLLMNEKHKSEVINDAVRLYYERKNSSAPDVVNEVVFDNQTVSVMELDKKVSSMLKTFARVAMLHPDTETRVEKLFEYMTAMHEANK